MRWATPIGAGSWTTQQGASACATTLAKPRQGTCCWYNPLLPKQACRGRRFRSSTSDGNGAGWNSAANSSGENGERKLLLVGEGTSKLPSLLESYQPAGITITG